jgi:cation:H+ antiporter
VPFLLLAVGFAAVFFGAVLFTNAVEWAGHRLRLGVGAVGTILAGVSTALPESAIPVLAVLRGDSEAEEVAIGAIVGAPFMLATIAMALVGVSAFAYAGRREQGRSLRVHRPTLRRDLVFFLALLSTALLLGVAAPREVCLVAAPAFVAAYAVYVLATVRRGGEVQPDDELSALISDPTKGDPPADWMIVVQFVGGLALIVAGAHTVVERLIEVAADLDVSPLVLALLVAPLATELPEKANSVFWVRQGKDALALGNLTGAMVFQSTLPVAVGLGFTEWSLDGYAVLAGILALGGGGVALVSLDRRRRFSAWAIASWTALFATFAASVWVLA